MPVLEFLPDWIYTFLLIPVVILFQKHFSLSSRVDVIETTQNLKKVDVEELQTCMKDLTSKIDFLSGQFDEHNKNSS